MKTLFLGLVALLLTGCMENEIDEAKELWSKVLSSESAEAEAEGIVAVRKFIFDKGITIIMNVKNNDGQIVNINALRGNESFSSVKITFDAGNGEFQAGEWVPKDRENVFLLFLE